MKSATQILLNGIQHYLCSTTKKVTVRMVKMANLNAVSENTEKEQSSDIKKCKEACDIKKCKEACKEMFDRIVSHILDGIIPDKHTLAKALA